MSKIKEYVRHLAVVAAATLLAQCAWAVDVISINFGSGQTNASMSDQEGNDGSLLKDVPASSWNDFNDNSATDSAVAHRWNGESQEDLSDVTVSFSGRGGNWYPHAAQRSTTSRFLNGYIDDGANSQVSITVKNVPYSTYGVIIYYNGDNSGHRFKPVEVNGARYSIQQGKTVPVASDAKTPIWGLPEQTTVGYGKNAIRVEGLTGTDLTIKPGIYESVNGSQCRGTVAAVQIYDPSTVEEVVINKDDVFSASAAEALDEADIYNLTIPAGGTFTMDADMTRSYNLISTGKVVLKGTNLTAANVSKLNDLTTGFIFRVEGEGSTEAPMNLGAGSYSYPEATVGAHDGNYAIYTIAGDNITITGGNNPPRNGISFDINGGSVTIGSEATGGFWTGVNGSYNQTAGTVTALQNSQNQNGTGDGLLLGYSGSGFSSMNISGGDLLVENSSLQMFILTTLNLSGTGHIKAKGMFIGNGTNHTVVMSDSAIFELGSLGWKGALLTMNGGTLKAYENTTMAGAITMAGDSTVEVPAGVELKFTGSLTGDGAITKKGEGILNVGTTRPTMDVKAGSVKIVATPSELVAGVLTLTVTPDATPASKDKVSVWDSEGNEVEITGVSIEGTTITITLKTLPSIDEDTAISDLELDPAVAGLIVVKGGATEEEAITITFDVDLPENVSMEINGFVEFVAGEGIEIPYAKMTFGEDATLIFDVIDGFDIPAGAAVIAGTASGTITNAGTLKIGTMTSGSITNSGTINITGDSTFSLANTGTLNINSGVSTVSSSAQAIKGTINIAFGATYKANSNDQVPYNGSATTTVNVYGTLDMQNHRWTVGGADTINLYGGCTVSGQGDNDGIFDLYRDGNVINVQPGEGDQAEISVVTIPAPVRARNANGNIFIAQGMKLALTGGIKNGGDVAGATINMNGNGRLTGTIPLYGGTINLGTSVGTIDAKFVAESGDTALKLGEGAGYTDITTTDTAEEPIIWVKPNATLQLYVKDFSSWTGASTEHAWVKNDGTLNIRENGGSRYFRGHLVMKPGTTTTLYGTSKNFIVYGGNSDQAKAQMIVPASEEATTATFAGEGTIQLNVNGSGGTNGSAWDIGANSTLDVQTKVIGGEALVKYGAGTLKLSNAENTYTGAVTLKAGTIKSATTLNVTCGDANMKLVTTSSEGVTTYSLVQRDATDIYLTYADRAYGYVLGGGAETTPIENDVIVVDSAKYTDIWHVGEYATLPDMTGHNLKLVSEMNFKGGGFAASQTVVVNASVYLYGNIGASAAISGSGTLNLGHGSDTVIGDGVEIACGVGFQGTNKATINGAVTISGTITMGNGLFKLAEDATLTCAALPEGKVVSGVEGKVAEYDGTKYTLVDAAEELPGEEYFSGDDADAYKAWAEATGVTADTDHENAEDLAIAYSLGVTGTTTVAAAIAAAKDKVEDLIAQIDCSKLAGEDGLTVALATLNETLATKGLKATLKAVPSTEIETTAKLYRLVISAIPANTEE